MIPTEVVAATFEQERPRLRAVATGVLGSTHEADDAVQEAWFRLDRADIANIDNLSGWLTVVVSRIALDHVRSRASRREVTIDTPGAFEIAVESSAESAVILEESVYEALTHALDRLSPLESATFVLHDLFRLPFDEISAIIERSPEATRKLASRARQKISASDLPRTAPGQSHRAIVEAFFAAAQSGDLNGLIALLAPNAVLRADRAAAQMGIQAEINGSNEIARQLVGKAHAARIAWIDGDPGAIWAHRGAVRATFGFSIQGDEIQEIWLRANPVFLESIDIEIEPAQIRRSAGEVDSSGASC
ncbi:MAG TPA: sigma-70 family RNA polymerase sigma factor [Thermomicrobiales bacterium]|nr:sigma-70 family RNA polymerase sigma factor [Thermomicrobiales bacterium]